MSSATAAYAATVARRQDPFSKCRTAWHNAHAAPNAGPATTPDALLWLYDFDPAAVAPVA
jgi:hypothetical protein